MKEVDKCMIILPKDCFFDENLLEQDCIYVDDMTETQWIEALKPYQKQYQEIFGYIPNMCNYFCTKSKFIDALLKALEEKKEISVYLKGI